jgi:exosortase/archaeosortase family protein
LQIVLIGSKWGLSILGYDYVSGYNSLAILGSYGVIIGNPCVGFGLSYGFASLIGAYPGPIKKKIWFIPLGILLISSINVARVIALTTSVYKTGGFVQMEEHDLFNNIIYIFIFLMWLVWVKLINKIKI